VKVFLMIMLAALLPSVAGAAEQPLTLLTMKPGAEGAETYSTSPADFDPHDLAEHVARNSHDDDIVYPNHCGSSHPATSDGDHANAV
jgi:hypothetical protein